MSDQKTKSLTNPNDYKAAEAGKDFWSKYSKTILYISSGIVLILGGWLGYNQFIL